MYNIKNENSMDFKRVDAFKCSSAEINWAIRKSDRV